MSALRFWCTPGEAWIRVMARLHGVRAVVVSKEPGARTVAFSLSLSADQRRMRIKMNDEFVILDRVQAAQLLDDMARTVSEMPAEPVDG